MRIAACTKHLSALAMAVALAACSGGLDTNGSGSGSSTNTQGAPTTAVTATSGNKLITFDRNSPTSGTTSVNIAGLAQGQFVVGMAQNPSNNQIVALTNTGAMYLLNVVSGVATPLQGMEPSIPTLSSLVSSGPLAGFGFNPVTGLLQVIGANGQNALINLNGSLVTSGTGFTGSLSGSGFSNAVSGAATTTLSGINGSTGQLLLNINPNGGAIGSGTPLNLGTITGEAGYSVDAMSQNAYALLDINNVWKEVQLNLSGTNTGSPATILGNVPGLSSGDTPSAMTLIQPVMTLIGLANGNTLLSFLPTDPNTILSQIPVQGLTNGQSLVALANNPLTNTLYGLANNGQLFQINPQTGVTQLISQLSQPLQGSQFSMALNPVTGLLEVISNQGQNLQLSPTGVTTLLTSVTNLLSSLIGTLLGHTPAICGASFTNNFSGATLSNLLTLDAGNNVLLDLINGSGSGSSSIGNLGIGNFSCSGLTILGGTNGLSFATITSALQNGPSTLYSINPTTGVATLVSTLTNTSSLIGGSNGLPIQSLTSLLSTPAGLPSGL